MLRDLVLTRKNRLIYIYKSTPLKKLTINFQVIIHFPNFHECEVKITKMNDFPGDIPPGAIIPGAIFLQGRLSRGGGRFSSRCDFPEAISPGAIFRIP